MQGSLQPYPAEARFVALAREIPGFGGYFFGADGNLHAYLTDLSHEKELRDVTRDLLDRQRGASRRRGKRPRLIVQQGQFDFILSQDGATTSFITANSTCTR